MAASEKNLQTLGDNLFDLFNQVKEDKMDLEKASTLVTISNTIINTAKVQMAGIRQLNELGYGSNLTGYSPNLTQNAQVENIIGDVFDKKYEYAKLLGYKNVSDAYGILGKEEFERKFAEIK